LTFKGSFALQRKKGTIQVHRD